MDSPNTQTTKLGGYAPVDGLKMHYEIDGSGDPFIYLPPAFGFAGMKSFPARTQSLVVITVDFQGHGRTADVPERPHAAVHQQTGVGVPEGMKSTMWNSHRIQGWPKPVLNDVVR